LVVAGLVLGQLFLLPRPRPVFLAAPVVAAVVEQGSLVVPGLLVKETQAGLHSPVTLAALTLVVVVVVQVL
jgi:hypothetical protein